jgi:GntR family transcriptional regulator, negative regulator for fad regulon and positive regulator of fabA
MTSYHKPTENLYLGWGMPKFEGVQKPVKPAEFAENQLLEAILDGSYGPGDVLPAERLLAQSLGVTRPTLRETLQRLSKEGWVTIAHGKPTRVNDYLAAGGLGILNTLSRFNTHFSPEMTGYLLEARTLIFPGVAQQAAEKDPDAIQAYLVLGVSLEMDAKFFATHDWGLQMLMVEITGNPVLKMMFNDFSPVYHRLGQLYFTHPTARKMSLEYYGELRVALGDKKASVHGLVERTMVRAQRFWSKI